MSTYLSRELEMVQPSPSCCLLYAVIKWASVHSGELTEILRVHTWKRGGNEHARQNAYPKYPHIHKTFHFDPRLGFISLQNDLTRKFLLSKKQISILRLHQNVFKTVREKLCSTHLKNIPGPADLHVLTLLSGLELPGPPHGLRASIHFFFFNRFISPWLWFLWHQGFLSSFWNFFTLLNGTLWIAC